MSYLAIAQVLFRLYEKGFSPLSVSRWPRAALVCLSCASFAACAVGQSVQQRPARPAATASAQPTETAPLAYYAGVDQLTVYSEPRSSSSPLTQLPLHQKVYRHKTEKGYAYIKVEGSGVTGWVDNARLIWRLPPQQQKASTKTVEQAPTPTQETPVAEEQPPPTAAEAVIRGPIPTAAEAPAGQKPATPADVPTSVPPAPSTSPAPSAPRPINPSIFNPF
jgi:SH3 domain-containing protein